MAYVLEEITSEIADQIIKDFDCDSEKKKKLMARGGYFSSHNINRAVRKDENYYLFSAPKGPTSPDKDYYFYYENKVYKIRVIFLAVYVFYFVDDECNDPDVIKNIENAFDAYGFYGESLNFNIKYRGF